MAGKRERIWLTRSFRASHTFGHGLAMISFILALALGLGLAAAAGFRVFVPLLAGGIAARQGVITIAPSFEWLATTPALVALGVATLLEVVAYYVPWLDNALDTIATPAAVAAGAVTTASVLTDVPPMIQWFLAIVGGGGVAGMVQGATVALRLKSAALTGGLGNPVVSTSELLGALTTVLLAIFVPLLCILLLVVVLVLIFRTSGRVLFGRRRII